MCMQCNFSAWILALIEKSAEQTSHMHNIHMHTHNEYYMHASHGFIHSPNHNYCTCSLTINSSVYIWAIVHPLMFSVFSTWYKAYSKKSSNLRVISLMFLFFWLLYHSKRNYIAVYNEYNTNSYDITITLPLCIYQE